MCISILFWCRLWDCKGRTSQDWHALLWQPIPCHTSSTAPSEERKTTLLSCCISLHRLSVKTVQSRMFQKRREWLKKLSAFFLFTLSQRRPEPFRGASLLTRAYGLSHACLHCLLTRVHAYITPHDAFKDLMLDTVISVTLKGGAGKMFGHVVICSLT